MVIEPNKIDLNRPSMADGVVDDATEVENSLEEEDKVLVAG